jgi:glycerol-3-phosphate acyltransferase PlsX
MEEGKGNDLTKAAYELLKSEDLHFIGNVEGGSLVSGEADVVVCDGFSGNLMLKNIEGTGRAAQQLVEHFRSENPALCEEIITRLASTFNLNDMGGATFLGTRKPIIKMHGCANKHTVLACAEQLFRLMKGGILDA